MGFQNFTYKEGSSDKGGLILESTFFQSYFGCIYIILVIEKAVKLLLFFQKITPHKNTFLIILTW